jgi:transposase
VVAPPLTSVSESSSRWSAANELDYDTISYVLFVAAKRSVEERRKAGIPAPPPRPEVKRLMEEWRIS